MLKDLPVHMLWVSGELSRLARLSLASFLSQWLSRRRCGAMIPTTSVQKQTRCRMPALLLPMPQDDAANMAYLTSLFRYRVLAEQGGIWADMDVVALTADPKIAARPLVASEKRRPFRHAEPTATHESLTQVTNCFMANPHPEAGDLWHRAVDRVAALNPEDRTGKTSARTCSPA